MRSALIGSGVSSFGAESGATTVRGCGRTGQRRNDVTETPDWRARRWAATHQRIYDTALELFQQHGFESRAKHDGNQKVLYLATDMRQAKQYADTRVTGQERKLQALPYRDRPDVEPVILRVTIPDPHNLVADDDAANSVIRKISYSLWKKKPREEQDRIMAELSQRQGWKVDVLTTSRANRPSARKVRTCAMTSGLFIRKLCVAGSTMWSAARITAMPSARSPSCCRSGWCRWSTRTTRWPPPRSGSATTTGSPRWWRTWSAPAR